MDLNYARKQIQLAREGRAVALDVLLQLIDAYGVLGDRLSRQDVQLRDLHVRVSKLRKQVEER
jgi:hypothetical protein